MTDGYAPPPAPAAHRVERAVSREMRRQTRLATLFAVLLVVPLVLAAYYYVWGRTDRQIVQDEVRRRVAPVEEATRAVQPALERVQRAATDVREQQRVLETQQQEVDALVRDQERVARQVETLAAQMPEVEATIGRARDAERRVAELQETLTRQNRRLDSVEQTQQRLAVELRGLREGPARPSDEALDALRRRLDALDGRVSQVESRVRPR
jgi:chromosome segregation ATPase